MQTRTPKQLVADFMRRCRARLKTAPVTGSYGDWTLDAQLLYETAGRTDMSAKELAEAMKGALIEAEDEGLVELVHDRHGHGDHEGNTWIVNVEPTAQGAWRVTARLHMWAISE